MTHDETTREPRVWHAGDPQPAGVTRVADCDGDEWERRADGWRPVDPDFGHWRAMDWEEFARHWGPLTEVRTGNPPNLAADGQTPPDPHPGEGGENPGAHSGSEARLADAVTVLTRDLPAALAGLTRDVARLVGALTAETQEADTDDDLTRAATADLVAELTRRRALPRCPCGKWRTYVGPYDSDGYTTRCHGCLRAVARCTCR